MDDLPMISALGPDVVVAFAETARSLYASEDLSETLERVTDAALRLVTDCDMTSVSVLDNGRILTMAATHPAARRADEIQHRLGEGPCLDAAGTSRLVHTPDTSKDDRWPRFGPTVAHELGICSIVSCRLSVLLDRERVLGSLNLYGRVPDAFTEDDVGIALLLGVHTGAVVAASLDHAHLQEALQSRDVIGQAKGILMERFKVTADDAFNRLRLTSQRLNLKLRDLARDLAETGDLP